MTDPIADMLTRIRNAVAVNKSELVLPYSKLKWAIAKLLEKEHYLESVEKISVGRFEQIRIVLKYSNNGPAIRHLKKVSKPGQRIYISSSEIPQVLNGFGTVIMSTSKGVMTGKEAEQSKVGGEFMFEIW